MPAHAADQAVVLEFGQFRVGDAGLRQQLVAGEGTGSFRCRRSELRLSQALPDHSQRKVRVALERENLAEPLDVRGPELTVTRPGPFGLDQAFSLQETDLGPADVRKFRT
jgi:hypothetical protein